MIKLPVHFNRAIRTISRRLSSTALSTPLRNDQASAAAGGQRESTVGSEAAGRLPCAVCAPSHPTGCRLSLRAERTERRTFSTEVQPEVKKGGRKSAGKDLSTMSVPDESPAPESVGMQEQPTESSASSASPTASYEPALGTPSSETSIGFDECQYDGEEAGSSSQFLSNPYVTLTVEEIMQRYSEQKSQPDQPLNLEQYNEFLYALRCRRATEEALVVLEDMKMSSVAPDSKAYANAFLAGAYNFFANELEDLVTSNVAIFSAQDRKYDVKKRVAQVYLEAVNERGIQFQGELYAPLILSCVSRDNRKEFAAAAYVFSKLCVSKGFPVAYSVYSFTMASLNKHDLDSLVVSLYEAVPSDVVNYHLQLHYLRALIKQDRATEVFRLLDGFMEGKERKIQIFNVLINAALRKGHLMIARSLYNKMIAMEVKPDDTTLGLFIEYSGRQPEGGLALMEEFIQEASKQQVNTGPKYLNALTKAYIRLDVSRVVPVLKQAAEANSVDRALLETVVTMMADPKLPSYLKLEIYSVVSKFVAGKQPKDTFVASMYALIDSRILELFAAIEELVQLPEAREGRQSTQPLYSEPAYRAIMRGFVIRRQTDAVLAFAEYILGKNMQFTSIPSYLLNAAAEVAAERGDYVQAMDITRNMRYRGIPLKPYVKEKVELLRSRSKKPTHEEMDDDIDRF